MIVLFLTALIFVSTLLTIFGIDRQRKRFGYIGLFIAGAIITVLILF